MALLVGITAEGFLPREAELIEAAFDAGLDVLHLRKPVVSIQQTEALLRTISSSYRNRIVLNDYHVLAQQYGVRGIHLNHRNPSIPVGYVGSVSRSCHSFEEVVRYKASCDYLFLSPICDSVSKTGYKAAFTRDELRCAACEGIIDKQVIAMGGITPENATEVLHYGFGGVALLGALWAVPEVVAVQRVIKEMKSNIK